MQSGFLPNIQNSIAIASGKGGVGKSTACVGLAQALQKQGHSVGILDADIYGPSIAHMLGVSKPPGERDGFVVPAEGSGISYISCAFLQKDNAPAAVRAPIANKIIEQFIDEVAWGNLEFLLIDLPPGTGDIHLTALQALCVSGAVLVTTPQQTALLDVHKALMMLRRLEVPLLGLIENMAYLETAGEMLYPFGKGNAAAFARSEQIPFLGALPLDAEISKGLDAGRPELGALFSPFLQSIEGGLDMGGFSCELKWDDHATESH